MLKGVIIVSTLDLSIFLEIDVFSCNPNSNIEGN